MSQQLLYCPLSKTTLQPVSAAQVEAFNDLVKDGQVFNRKGDEISGVFANLLINENLDTIYLIRQNIPQLISTLSISLEGLKLVNSVD